ncbi:MAG: WG repeat-containing protein [Cyclobacteriaceae bacterium]|nr:WG repeat-containing protein [Cyclobacteriaceae bacterium]UYN86031.1 MAG: WG repeat-containing protein [Cyclobacteriaceae bacterium]
MKLHLTVQGLNIRVIINGIFLLSFSATLAQTTAERLALNNLQKGKWEKSKMQLTKAIRKDTMNATAHYVLSTYFFVPENPAFQIDSAYANAVKALHLYQLSNQKQRDRMRRFPLDSALLVARREQIDSAAFERAKRINTEQAYIDFIQRFTTANQLGRARELRDEVAYIDALKENTYSSFLSYLTRYPHASRVPEASERYEKLLFEAKTKDRKLVSYESFIDEYPNSPYRAEAELQVLELSTAGGSPAAFLNFLKRYPVSKHMAKARNILYYLLVDNDQPLPPTVVNDSIRHVRNLEQDYLVPFLKDGKFGFMNSTGKEVIKPIADELEKEYRCGNITEELLVVADKIIGRNGAVIFSGEVDEADDLGNGYLLVSVGKCSSVIHKSGFVLDACVQDARVIADAFVALKKNNRWSMVTLLGRSVPLGDFDDIDSFDDVVVLKQASKIRLSKKESIAKAVDQGAPVYTRNFDEVKRWDGNMLWVRAGDTQGLLDMHLRERIPFGKKEIKPTFFGAVSVLAEGQKLWSSQTGESEIFSRTQIQKPWVLVQQAGRWKMADQHLKVFAKTSYDSVYFIGAFCMALSGDTLHAYVAPDRFVSLNRFARVQFLPGKDSVYYLLLDEGDKKTVFNSRGERLFTANYDRLEVAGENMFLAIRKEKRGLINLQGKPLVQPEYDAMGTVEQGSVPVLKDRKFGFLDVIGKKEIKPQYEKNLIRYNARLLIAHKGGLAGLIDWTNKPVTPFEYEEIRYWNDSSALVKRNFQWMIYNFIDKRVVIGKIKSFRWLRDTPEEKLLIIFQENNYGVISNKNGTVLPATYSDIVNLGSVSKPLYFTEKHVEEASIYVVIYYDHTGKLIRRQVFEVDDYERIYCSHN